METAKTKDRLATIFWFAYTAAELDPYGFERINFDAKHNKPVVKLQKNATNRPFQLATKLVHWRMRRAMNLDEGKARTNYHKWAKAFRWAADEGNDTQQKFRDLLNTTSMNEMIKGYESRQNGPNKDDLDKLAVAKDSQGGDQEADDHDEAPSTGTGPGNVAMLLNRLKLTRLKIALSRLPDTDPDKADLLKDIEQMIESLPVEGV